MRPFSTFALTAILIFPLIGTAQINKTEKKIIQSVDNNNPTYTSLLKEIVNINSGTMNFEGVRKVGEILMSKFTELGFETTWIDGSEFGRAGHLVAVHKGKKGPKMMLIGHLDTVFEPDNPFQTYSMLNDSIMKGPGVADMKGGDIIILMAMHALKDAGVLKDMHIEIVMTGDEEKSGSPLELSKKALTVAAERADIALGFENADGKPETIVISRRSSSGWDLKVKGKSGHSSQVFGEHLGAGAIYETSRILTEFYNQLTKEENLTFNPGLIVGGTMIEFDPVTSTGKAFGKSNVVAQDVVVRGDIRAVSPEQLEKAQKIMKQIVEENLPKTSAEITFLEGGYPPLAPTDGNRKLLSYYNKVSNDLGFGEVKAVNPRNAGAADVSFTSGLVEMAVDGLGLSGADDHSVNETGNLNMLPVQAKRAAVLMYRLTNGLQ